MKMFVKPALPTAKIPDPMMGDDLPAEGREVDWSPYWERLQALEDEIIVAPPTPGGEVPPTPVDDQPPAPDGPTRRSRFAPSAPKQRDADAGPGAGDTAASASTD